MKEVDRKKIPKNTTPRKFSAKPEKRDPNLQNKSNRRVLKVEDAKVKASSAKGNKGIVVSDSNTGSESSEVFEDAVVDDVDEIQGPDEAAPSDDKTLQMSEKEANSNVSDHSRDLKHEPTEDMGEESDTNSDCVSSQVDLAAADDDKVVRFRRGIPESDLSDGSSKFERVTSDQNQAKASKSPPLKPLSPSDREPSKRDERDADDDLKNVRVQFEPVADSLSPDREPSKRDERDADDDLKNVKVQLEPVADSSGTVDKPIEEAKDADVLNETSNSTNVVESNDETVNAREISEGEPDVASDQKIQEMESRVEKLEEELREVAALEIALYSVVPEHGSSAHKVHTPSRRLCRLYIHACKHWSPQKRATIARNSVSGLILVAKSCGHDVSRLSFWLSNTVVLREMISETFASSCQSGPLMSSIECNGVGNKNEAKSTSMNTNCISGTKLPKKQSFIQLVDDWQETRTFTDALQKVESWVFSRMVESIWWQALAPHMLSPSSNEKKTKVLGKMVGSTLGDQHQGSFSANLWNNAFEDSLRRLCPVRAEGHECGCLPVLARKVMDQCLARLDVAMFNAILRESEHEIPTDPVSDPIVDSRVLPIPAGDLSFGSGAQLKNTVGNWSRCLNDLFGTGADDMKRDDRISSDYFNLGTGDESKCFDLLNALSDLLMLPKDMILDRAIRMEVCPQISLPLVKRILCNFTLDEFCPDPVPGSVLEALNAECIIERRLLGGLARSFPYSAAPVVYIPPSTANMAEAGGKLQLSRSASAIQRKGYTSDEDLVELDCPLATVVEKTPTSPANMLKGINHQKEIGDLVAGNARYELLREVWQAK